MEVVQTATDDVEVRRRSRRQEPERDELAALDAAFAAVFERNRAALLRLAYVVAGDGHRAEEAVAEAVARSWPHWRRGGVADPDAYLRRAVVNQLRGGGRRAAVQRRFLERRQPAREAAGADAGLAERDAVLAALARLPVRQRAAVALRFLEDRSEADVAAILGTRVGTVKSQVSRGLERLRTELGEDWR